MSTVNLKNFRKRLMNMSDENLLRLRHQHQSVIGHGTLEPYQRENIERTLSVIESEVKSRNLSTRSGG